MESQVPTPIKPPRRRIVEVLLVYPVLRYLIPPPVADLGGDEVVASKVGDLSDRMEFLYQGE